MLDSKQHYANVPNTLPRFVELPPTPPQSPVSGASPDTKSNSTPDSTTANCTFTIRIPRHFLTPSSLQTTCAERQIWGTDVYTDDSDPLCAAIHSGWIRGSWPDDVDEKMLDVDMDTDASSAPAAADDATTTVSTQQTPPTLTLTTPPSTGPKPPPADLDLHLTLLLLPPLEKYTASSWHGVRSRSWGENHDGGSFKVDKVEWVAEGAEGRYQERGGEARRRRLLALSFGGLKGLSGGGVRAGKNAERARGGNGSGNEYGLLGLRIQVQGKSRRR